MKFVFHTYQNNILVSAESYSDIIECQQGLKTYH